MDAQARGASAPLEKRGGSGTKLWVKTLPWAIALLCFGYLYTKTSGAAARGIWPGCAMR